MRIINYVPKISNEWSLGYEDVFILPQYSEITSRKEVDTSIKVGPLHLDVPVISSNMDTVTDANMAIAMFKAGAIGALHRFMTIEDNCKEYGRVRKEDAECFVSVGVNDESKVRAEHLFTYGARYFIIDIAHGHSLMMKNMIYHMRSKYGSRITLMAGNVATAEGAADLAKWGADIVKVGIGPGAVCLTKNVTGVTKPQFSAVLSCSDSEVMIVADGGVNEIGDICKAIGVGASLVMCGKLFSSCVEAPGARINGKKVYRGMASRDAMLTIKQEDDLPTPEGMSIMINENGSANDVVKNIKGGLQSSMSYSNSRTIEEFQIRCKFGVSPS